MNTVSHRDWTRTHFKVADDIYARHGKIAEIDAEILLCCVTSALAAAMWPGEKIDRARFIEFLIQFAPPDANVTRISIPLLVGHLEDSRDTQSASALRERFYPQSDARIVTGDEIDKADDILTKEFPALSPAQLRKDSYAAIFYTDLRCPLVHNYGLGPRLKSWGMSSETDVPSYVNMMTPADSTEVVKVAKELGITEEATRRILTKTVRHLYLPYPYIRRVVIDAAEAAFDWWDTASSWERRRPTKWWIQG